MTRADITASICDADTQSAGSQRERKPSGEQAHAADAHKFAPLMHTFGPTGRENRGAGDGDASTRGPGAQRRGGATHAVSPDSAPRRLAPSQCLRPVGGA